MQAHVSSAKRGYGLNVLVHVDAGYITPDHNKRLAIRNDDTRGGAGGERRGGGDGGERRDAGSRARSADQGILRLGLTRLRGSSSLLCRASRRGRCLLKRLGLLPRRLGLLLRTRRRARCLAHDDAGGARATGLRGVDFRERRVEGLSGEGIRLANARGHGSRRALAYGHGKATLMGVDVRSGGRRGSGGCRGSGACRGSGGRRGSGRITRGGQRGARNQRRGPLRAKPAPGRAVEPCGFGLIERLEGLVQRAREAVDECTAEAPGRI